MTVAEMMEALGLAANEDAARKMTEYNAMLMAMNKKVNLTGIKDGEESLIKNIYDSMTVYDPAYFPQNGRVLDLGTGAGFPGVPLAILRPDMYVVLVDSIQKKLIFIEDACRELGIRNVKCVHIRAEEGGRRRKTRESFDVVTARAVKAMPVISEWAMPFVKVGGVFCAMKGPGVEEELKQAGRILRELHGTLEEKKELTLPAGDKRVILYIRKTAPCPKTYPRKVGIENLRATADMSTVTGQGSFTVPVTVTVSGFSDVTVRGTYELTLTITDTPPQTEPAVPAGGEDQTVPEVPET